MSSVAVFGKIYTADQLEYDTIDLLKKWFGTYLREMAIQNSLTEDLIVPVNYTTRNGFDSTLGEPLPKVIVLSPGVGEQPKMSGTGQYRATWRLGVGVAIAADTETKANTYAKIYGAAVRAMMLQQGGNELDAKVTWVDENYTDLPILDQLQQYRAASIWFMVDKENVSSRRGGPLQPDQDPYSYGQVETIDIDLEKVDTDDSV